MYEFEEINLYNINLNEFNSFENKSVFTTVEWVKFVEEDSNAQPIILRITRSGNYIGYFIALMIRKLGVRIVASPFSGWSTCFMGFDFICVNHKTEVLNELSEYLFKRYRAMYIEILDQDIDVKHAKLTGFNYEEISTLELDINRTDEEIFKVFKTDCRNYIRQFQRRGATIEEAIPNDEFAEEYYDQLIDVFAKQGLVPTYSLEKVKCLLRHLAETNMCLCLRVRDPNGMSIATSIFVGYKKKFFFWGGASIRPYQSYRPNEYMIWYAIKYWRKRGCRIFDMVGVREYKRKFGPIEKEYAKIIIPKYLMLIFLKDYAKKIYFFILKVKGFVLRKK